MTIKKEIFFIQRSEIEKILSPKLKIFEKAKILSLICRLNTLSMIKRAGSGHLGTSMSALDIMVWIKFFLQKKNKLNDLNRDIFFFI